MALKTVCAMTLTLCLFANGKIPPTPPSSAEQQQLSERVKSYIHTLEQVPQEVSCTHEPWPYSDAVVASKGPGLVVVDFARSEPKRTEGLVSQIDLKPFLEDLSRTEVDVSFSHYAMLHGTREIVLHFTDPKNPLRAAYAYAEPSTGRVDRVNFRGFNVPPYRKIFCRSVY